MYKPQYLTKIICIYSDTKNQRSENFVTLFLPLYERDYHAEVMIRRKKDWWISPSIVRRERCHQHERCDNKDANVHMTQADAAVKYNPAISAS